MREIYLDNSATTRVCAASADMAVHMMRTDYGNPSSLHSMGFAAERAMENARKQIAARLSAEPAEILFTSGGTESDNLALFGAAYARRRLGSRIVTTAVEHPAVLEAARALEKEGFEVIFVSPAADGSVPAAHFADVIDEKTILVSAMAVNNETGAVLPLKEIAGMIRRKKAPALFHTDAVQAFCKIPLLPKRLGVDLVSVSGHKVHAPKGVGALYMAKGTRLLPRVFGGGQERGLRPGTQSVPLICAFGAAVEALPAPEKTLSAVQAVGNYLRARLSEIPGAHIHGPADALPYITSFSAGAVQSETMLHFLAERGIYVSGGSACGRAKPSHVLKAMGTPDREIATALRVSLSAENTKEDIDAFLSALSAGMQTLSHI